MIIDHFEQTEKLEGFRTIIGNIIQEFTVSEAYGEGPKMWLPVKMVWDISQVKEMIKEYGSQEALRIMQESSAIKLEYINRAFQEIKKIKYGSKKKNPMSGKEQRRSRRN